MPLRALCVILAVGLFADVMRAQDANSNSNSNSFKYLENIEIKITKENEKLYITVYDEDVEDDKSELKNIKKEELKIKLGKKTKLFI